MDNLNNGEIVRAHYNSGTYIGKIIEDRKDRYLIEVLAVEKHPLQGDIHNPGKVDGVFFHERKALAYHEKMNVKKPAVKPYTEAVPNYAESLKQAVFHLREKLQKEDSDFNRAALQCLDNLEANVYKNIYDK
ncbi:MAG TPA: kinase-associated lipoprotein B [Bacillota bacterium]|nr:kinase-associated lipoprotein B [Bacillota bacterium]